LRTRFDRSYLDPRWNIEGNGWLTRIPICRATRSADFRAPNLNHLFLPGGVTYTNNQRDLLTGITVGTRALPGERPEVTLSVNNVLNKEPPIAGFTTTNQPRLGGGYVNGDDVVGRYFTLGLRYRH
jgi:outer membrane receptor protein involved in Fe transport